MKKIDIFKKEIKKDWYIQGFSAFPIYLNPAAHSGFTMKKELGFGYTKFMFNYKDGFGEMWYLTSDFSRIWKIIRRKLKKDPKYLERVKKRYEAIFQENEQTFSKIDSSRLSRFSDQEILEMMKKCSLVVTDGVGIAHVLDPIGPEIEKDFKKELSRHISDRKKLNDAYSILTTPEELSFIAQEEEELRKMSKGPASEKRLEQHAKKYFWIQNSFAGGKNLKISFFEKRMKDLRNRSALKKISFRDKEKIIRKHKLNREIREMTKLINFSAIWQDQRKANAMKSVGYFEKILDEISRRTKVNKEILYYLGFSDILKTNSLADLKKKEKELTERRKGVLVLMGLEKETNLFGNGYNILMRYASELPKAGKEENEELHGSIASQGTASGEVAVCLGVKSISKVKNGDILVTSMTRPEFMPALKKAAAIITDEGGITSHAAIIARELGIPAVIGTKIATKVLKDGDLVEVRANHGVVKILRRK